MRPDEMGEKEMANANARWRAAQQYERNWWSGYRDTPDFYAAFTALVAELAGLHLELGQSTKILEIGSGAAGSLTGIDSARKFAIDPLEPFFSAQEHFRRVRDPRVIYLSARGEELPFGPVFFELVIMDNVLDHCEAPRDVIGEIARALVPNGVLFLRQNVYHGWGRLLRSCLELLMVDRGHPHTFSERELRELAVCNGLRIVERHSPGFFRGWFRDIRRGGLKGWVQALLCMSRNRLTLVMKKDGI